MLGSKVCKIVRGGVRHWQILIFTCGCSHDFPTQSSFTSKSGYMGKGSKQVQEEVVNDLEIRLDSSGPWGWGQRQECSIQWVYSSPQGCIPELFMVCGGRITSLRDNTAKEDLCSRQHSQVTPRQHSLIPAAQRHGPAHLVYPTTRLLWTLMAPRMIWLRLLRN